MHAGARPVQAAGDRARALGRRRRRVNNGWMDDSPPRARHAHGDAPLILFGAFDRHNFGDMLFASVAQAMLGARPVVCAGLAERDLTPWGGPRTVAISRLAATWHERYGDAPTHVIHVGGEILTCDSYEAAVMLHDARGARQAIAHYDAAPMERRRWAARYLGMERQAPYVLPRAALSRPGLLVFHAVGGVDLERREAPLRAEVLVSLRGADSVTVRDQRTREILAAAGVRAALAPDGAVLVAQLFASRVQRHAGAGEPARVRAAFPGGYIAVQFSADFGDDDTLSLIACQLDTASRETGWGVVFFRAGAAPWHDDLECYARAVARMTSHTHVFRSLDIWDIAALISHADRKSTRLNS